MLDKRRWKVLHNFENKRKEKFLKALTEKEAMEIFTNLYELAQKLAYRGRYRKPDPMKMKTLSKIRILLKGVR